MEFYLIPNKMEHNGEQHRSSAHTHTHTYLNYFLKSVHVLLHAVMGAQIGHKVAGVHAVETMKEGVHAGMQVNRIHPLSMA